MPPDFSSYRAFAVRLREVLLSFTPLVEPISLDEAFLDVSGATTLFGPPREIGRRIRAAVRSELSLVCSVGVAPSKLLAKLASAAAKPDGLLWLRAGTEAMAFLHGLPVEALWGVGERTREILSRLGARTVGDLADALGYHTVPMPRLAVEAERPPSSKVRSSRRSCSSSSPTSDGARPLALPEADEHRREPE